MQKDGDIAAIRHNLGNHIRLLRKGQHLSQYAFSDMIDLDRSYIIGVEKGRRNISIDNLCKIARGLGVSLSELCQGIDDEESIERRKAVMERLLYEDKQKKASKSASTQN